MGTRPVPLRATKDEVEQFFKNLFKNRDFRSRQEPAIVVAGLAGLVVKPKLSFRKI